MRDIMKKITLKRVAFKDKKDKKGKIIDTEIEVVESSYTMIFNINVLDALDMEYGTDDKSGLQEWGEIATSGTETERNRAFTRFLVLTVNEGARIENKHREKVGLPLLELISEDDLVIDIAEIAENVTNLVKESSPQRKN